MSDEEATGYVAGPADNIISNRSFGAWPTREQGHGR